MAATTIAKAIIDKHATLTYSGKPANLWHGTAPLRDTSGNPVTLPIAQFSLSSVSPMLTLECNRHETWIVSFEVYAETVGQAELIAYGVLNNGTDPTARAGLANADTFTMPSTYEYRYCTPLEGPRTVDIRELTASVGNVYLTTFSLSLLVERVG